MRRLILVLFALFLGTGLYAQRFILPKTIDQEKIRFELINNLMVVPMQVNGAELSFILDTGVSSPILFNLTDQDSIQINNVSTISLKGLGEGPPIEALKSENNLFKLGRAQSTNQRSFCRP